MAAGIQHDPDPEHIRSVFLAAIERTSREDRKQFLKETCGEDTRLQREVSTLLEAHDDATGHAAFLASPQFGQAIVPDDSEERDFSLSGSSREGAGGEIDGYQLIRRVGEGGFADVFEAQQSHPVHRRVALKLLKPGMDSGQVIARFEEERQALAVMQHPNIARVYDAGASPRGLPYFVMDLVHGEPITRFCDRHRLTIDQRLKLFIEICRAIQHAHQKAVIHRDLKPSNILVSSEENVPVPIVIDFGIAKAVRRDHSETLTSEGQFLGTPQYMSPEQTGMEGMDVDTRSDIYSLGIILFELLTGTTPLDPAVLHKASYGELERLIVEEEVPRPSVRLASLARKGNRLEKVAADRDTEGTPLLRKVRGDLDWIVLRAVDKDRTRRYESANALARDIERHLEQHPVDASPPSRTYLVRKFVRRNHTVVLAVAAVIVVLVAGVVVSRWQAIEAQRARTASEKARLEEKIVSTFLEDMIRNPSPDLAGRTLRLPDILALSSERLESETQLDPAIRARLYSAMGRSYGGLSMREEAVYYLERAVELQRLARGNQDPMTLEYMDELADAYRHAGEFEKGIALAEELVDFCAIAFEKGAPFRIAAMQNLADLYRAGGRHDEAVPLMTETVELFKQQFGPTHEKTLGALGKLALIHKAAGRISEAIETEENLIGTAGDALGFDVSLTLTHRDRLANYYLLADRLDDALRLASETVRTRSNKLGRLHAETLTSLSTLGRVHFARGEFEDAHTAHEEALAGRRISLGNEHHDTVTSINHLSIACLKIDDNQRALALAREALRLRARQFGPNHFLSVTAGHALAKCYIDTGEPAEAVPIYRGILFARMQAKGKEDPDTLYAMNNLANAYKAAEDFPKAIALHEALVAIREKVLGETHPSTINSIRNLGQTLLSERKDLDGAIRHLERALRLREGSFPENHASIEETRAALRKAYLAAGDEVGAGGLR